MRKNIYINSWNLDIILYICSSEIVLNIAAKKHVNRITPWGEGYLRIHIFEKNMQSMLYYGY